MCFDRYLGTILGSCVISTTVLGDQQPVSTAVRFQLHHRVPVSRGLFLYAGSHHIGTH